LLKKLAIPMPQHTRDNDNICYYVNHDYTSSYQRYLVRFLVIGRGFFSQGFRPQTPEIFHEHPSLFGAFTFDPITSETLICFKGLIGK
jgi:hypothetical protein